MDKERLWRALQKHQGYSDEEMALFRSSPKNVKMVEETPQFMTHKIIAEVVQSQNCHSQLKVGDRIVMNGNGQLIRDECPEKICIWALAPLGGSVNAVFERFAEHLDPNDILFDKVGCQDVGVGCGGWGRIVMQIRVQGPEGEKV